MMLTLESGMMVEERWPSARRAVLGAIHLIADEEPDGFNKASAS